MQVAQICFSRLVNKPFKMWIMEHKVSVENILFRSLKNNQRFMSLYHLLTCVQFSAFANRNFLSVFLRFWGQYWVFPESEEWNLFFYGTSLLLKVISFHSIWLEIVTSCELGGNYLHFSIRMSEFWRLTYVWSHSVAAAVQRQPQTT